MPGTVLTVLVREIDDSIGLLGVGAGHEDQAWRSGALAQDLIEWAADWILTQDEIESFSAGNAVRLISKALGRVYTSQKYEGRGEVGELLLHIVLRKFLNSERAISRIYFKDAPNDTVKGFDAVHVVEKSGKAGAQTELELWLGESKFYVDSAQAVSAVLSELEEHLKTNYLRTEFAAISDKLSPHWEHSDRLKALLSREVSLDTVFSCVVIPVFITFDDDITARHQSSSEAYVTEVSAMLTKEWTAFRTKLNNRTLPREIRVQLILLPMATKSKLISAFDGRLKAWQAMSNH